ncbi:MAG: hypothetical protein U0X20_11365 [Caldilineaceae bacterium]
MAAGAITNSHPITGAVRFVDAAGGIFNLMPNSLAIDAGDPASAACFDHDIDWVDRPAGCRRGGTARGRPCPSCGNRSCLNHDSWFRPAVMLGTSINEAMTISVVQIMPMVAIDTTAMSWKASRGARTPRTAGEEGVNRHVVGGDEVGQGKLGDPEAQEARSPPETTPMPERSSPGSAPPAVAGREDQDAGAQHQIDGQIRRTKKFMRSKSQPQAGLSTSAREQE